VRRVGDHADADAGLVMGVEEILQHHRAAAFAPGRAGLAVERAQVVGRLFGRVDMCVPVDDHEALSGAQGFR
jgi:hypothetical protein